MIQNGKTFHLCRPRKVDAEELLFGSSLPKHGVASVQLDSDQESTDRNDDNDEEEEDGGAGGRDALARLTPDHLLFK